MYTFVDFLVRLLKKVIPAPLVRILAPTYHKFLSAFMAFAYGFPARKLVVLGITGTKGKSTTTEMLFSILRAAGHKTALLSTIRFAIEDESEPNTFKMTLQGRGFAQAFMRKAVRAGCTHLVIEITSESVPQFRHRHLGLDGLIVTNIQKEHIESHGSFENYVAAKRAIVEELAHSKKPRRVLVANEDVRESRSFLLTGNVEPIGFSESEIEKYSGDVNGSLWSFEGTQFSLPLPGRFNAMNALSAVKLTSAFGVKPKTASQALAKLPPVLGRLERIDEGQDFMVVVDYAHTPDSLRALYSAFPEKYKICVLGNTGGGRDTWKRPEMGRIAEESCNSVILTNEDPYDEDPEAIVEAMVGGMQKKPTVIMDRRDAITEALRQARKDDVVLISGKGTDPFIMGPNGSKEPWSDADVVREELAKL